MRSIQHFEILRDATIQFEKSGLLEVPKGKEQTGGFVFFGKSVDKITHVGMMINNKEFIHSTTHEKSVVQILDLSDPIGQTFIRKPEDQDNKTISD